MASSTIILSCFLMISLRLGATTDSFVQVECKKSHIVAQYGTNTLLDCDVKSKFTDLKIDLVSWKSTESDVSVVGFLQGKITAQKPGFQFASSINASSRNVSLLITNTNLVHAGEYECQVLANRGEATATVNLKVESKFSKPNIHSDPDKIISEKSFALTCEANNGYPKGNIRWMVDGTEWKSDPKVEEKLTPEGLYTLTSTLSLTPNSQFRMFVCEVYNAKGVKEDHGEFDVSVNGKRSDPDPDEKPNISVQIVAPLVVIGSLIVGLLLLLVFRRRRQPDGCATADPAESDKMAV